MTLVLVEEGTNKFVLDLDERRCVGATVVVLESTGVVEGNDDDGSIVVEFTVGGGNVGGIVSVDGCGTLVDVIVVDGTTSFIMIETGDNTVVFVLLSLLFVVVFASSCILLCSSMDSFVLSLDKDFKAVLYSIEREDTEECWDTNVALAEDEGGGGGGTVLNDNVGGDVILFVEYHCILRRGSLISYHDSICLLGIGRGVVEVVWEIGIDKLKYCNSVSLETKRNKCRLSDTS